MLAEASLLVALSVQYGSGTAACLSAAALERSVENRLKRRVFVEAARADLRFVVSFERRDKTTEARIDVSDIGGRARGSRSLVTSSHCSALDDSLALSVALLVDQPPEPEVAVAAAGEGQTSPPPMIAQPATKLRVITIPEDVSAPRDPWHARVGLMGSALWGTLPSVVPGIALYFKLVPRHVYPIVLQGEMYSLAASERDSSSGARFRLLRVGLALCPPLHQKLDHSFGLCVGQRVGWLVVQGYGFDQAARERRLTYALTLGGEGTLRLFGPVSARAYLGAEVPVVRDQFASAGRNASTLFQPTFVGFAGEIGIQAAVW
jgi:hypothetical protein